MKTEQAVRFYPLLSTLLVFSLLVSENGLSQKPTTRTLNSLYIGYLTPGNFVSINTDRIIHQSTALSISLSIGLSAANKSIGVPVGVYLLSGQTNSHLEFSFVFQPYIEHYQYLFQAGNRSDKKGYLIPAIGYRYQRPSGGLFFRIAASPVIALDPRSDNFWKMDGKLIPGVFVGAGISF